MRRCGIPYYILLSTIHSTIQGTTNNGFYIHLSTQNPYNIEFLDFISNYGTIFFFFAAIESLKITHTTPTELPIGQAPSIRTKKLKFINCHVVGHSNEWFFFLTVLTTF